MLCISSLHSYSGPNMKKKQLGIQHYCIQHSKSPCWVQQVYAIAVDNTSVFEQNGQFQLELLAAEPTQAVHGLCVCGWHAFACCLGAPFECQFIACTVGLCRQSARPGSLSSYRHNLFELEVSSRACLFTSKACMQVSHGFSAHKLNPRSLNAIHASAQPNTPQASPSSADLTQDSLVASTQHLLSQDIPRSAPDGQLASVAAAVGVSHLQDDPCPDAFQLLTQKSQEAALEDGELLDADTEFSEPCIAAAGIADETATDQEQHQAAEGGVPKAAKRKRGERAGKRVRQRQAKRARELEQEQLHGGPQEMLHAPKVAPSCKKVKPTCKYVLGCMVLGLYTCFSLHTHCVLAQAVIRQHFLARWIHKHVLIVANIHHLHLQFTQLHPVPLLGIADVCIVINVTIMMSLSSMTSTFIAVLHVQLLLSSTLLTAMGCKTEQLLKHACFFCVSCHSLTLSGSGPAGTSCLASAAKGRPALSLMWEPL